MIKDGAEEIAYPLCHLINKSLSSGIFPTEEKIGKITPLYKSDSHSSFDNYRPISVLTVTSKIIERLVHNQLYEYLENNKLLISQQYGFRKNRSTDHAVTLLTDYIRSNMDSRCCTGAIYIDLKKAFDTVDHGVLLSKLKIYGILGKEHSWFCDYLFNRQQLVQYNNFDSDILTVTTGVPQGSILGPLLFILHMNDIVYQLEKCKMLLYADDMVIYYANQNSEVIEKVLNDEFHHIGNWLRENRLIINLMAGKTESILFGTPQKLAKSTKIKVFLNVVLIKNVEMYEYLGMILDQSLNFKSHLKKISKTAISRVKLLSRIRSFISPFVADSIYNVMIRPLLLTSDVETVLSSNMRKKFQSIQDRCYKIVRRNKSNNTWKSIDSLCKECICLKVHKSLNGNCPDTYVDYFDKLEHGINTRRNGKIIRLPRVRSENGCKTFRFQGALIFNDLCGELASESDSKKFRDLLKNHFTDLSNQ